MFEHSWVFKHVSRFNMFQQPILTRKIDWKREDKGPFTRGSLRDFKGTWLQGPKHLPCSFLFCPSTATILSMLCFSPFAEHILHRRSHLSVLWEHAHRSQNMMRSIEHVTLSLPWRPVCSYPLLVRTKLFKTLPPQSSTAYTGRDQVDRNESVFAKTSRLQAQHGLFQPTPSTNLRFRWKERYERSKGHRYERSKDATKGSWPYYW